MLLKNKKGILILIVIVASIVVLVLINYNRPIYGNDEESIKHLIYDIELINKDSEEIYIVDTKDIEESRFVGFCTQFGKTGIIKFELNKDGNYVYIGAELRESEVGTFVVCTRNNNINGSFKTLYITVTDETDGYTARLAVNDEYEFEGKIPTGKRTMLVFEMPEVSGDGYTYNFELIDLCEN